MCKYIHIYYDLKMIRTFIYEYSYKCIYILNHIFLYNYLLDIYYDLKIIHIYIYMYIYI